jgi:hypothetical protein
LGVELDGIVREVPHHLLQALGIAADTRRRRIELHAERDVLGLGGGAHRVERCLHQLRQIQPANLQMQLAGDDARAVQNVFDQPDLSGGVALDGLDRAQVGARIELAGAQQPRPTQDGVERCA